MPLRLTGIDRCYLEEQELPAQVRQLQVNNNLFLQLASHIADNSNAPRESGTNLCSDVKHGADYLVVCGA